MAVGLQAPTLPCAPPLAGINRGCKPFGLLRPHFSHFWPILSPLPWLLGRNGTTVPMETHSFPCMALLQHFSAFSGCNKKCFPAQFRRGFHLQWDKLVGIAVLPTACCWKELKNALHASRTLLHPHCCWAPRTQQIPYSCAAGMSRMWTMLQICPWCPGCNKGNPVA